MKFTVKNSPQYLELFQEAPLVAISKLAARTLNTPLELNAMVIVDEDVADTPNYVAKDGEVFNLLMQDLGFDQLFFLQPQMIEDRILPIMTDDLALMFGTFEQTKKVGFEILVSYTDADRPEVTVENV